MIVRTSFKFPGTKRVDLIQTQFPQNKFSLLPEIDAFYKDDKAAGIPQSLDIGPKKCNFALLFKAHVA